MMLSNIFKYKTVIVNCNNIHIITVCTVLMIGEHKTFLSKTLHDWFDDRDDFQTEIRTCTSIHGCTGALWLQVSARSWRWELEDSDTETKSSPLGRTAGNSLPSLQNKWHQPKPAAPKSLREKKKQEKISWWWSKHLYYYYSQLISENKLHPQYWTT